MAQNIAKIEVIVRHIFRFITAVDLLNVIQSCTLWKLIGREPKLIDSFNSLNIIIDATGHDELYYSSSQDKIFREFRRQIFLRRLNEIRNSPYTIRCSIKNFDVHGIMATFHKVRNLSIFVKGNLDKEVSDKIVRLIKDYGKELVTFNFYQRSELFKSPKQEASSISEAINRHTMKHLRNLTISVQCPYYFDFNTRSKSSIFPQLTAFEIESYSDQEFLHYHLRTREIENRLNKFSLAVPKYHFNCLTNLGPNYVKRNILDLGGQIKLDNMTPNESFVPRQASVTRLEIALRKSVSLPFCLQLISHLQSLQELCLRVHDKLEFTNEEVENAPTFPNVKVLGLAFYAKSHDVLKSVPFGKLFPALENVILENRVFQEEGCSICSLNKNSNVCFRELVKPLMDQCTGSLRKIEWVTPENLQVWAIERDPNYQTMTSLVMKSNRELKTNPT